MNDDELFLKIACSMEFCPFCGTPECIDSKMPQIDGPEIYVPTSCTACGKSWIEYFRFYRATEETNVSSR